MPRGCRNPGKQDHDAAKLVALTRHLYEAHPNYYRLYRQPEFEWKQDPSAQQEPSDRRNVGRRWIATGFAEVSAFSLAVSMQRGDRRVFSRMGGSERKERIDESRRVLDWAMTAFEKRRIFADGETIGEASVYGGADSRVALVRAARSMFCCR